MKKIQHRRTKLGLEDQSEHRPEMKFTMDPDLPDRIREAARKAGKSISWWVCDVIRAALR